MVTSADDLLRQAQSSTYAATRALTVQRYGQAIEARQAYHGYTAAWPRIARAHLHLLNTAPLHGNPAPDLDQVRRSLDRIAAGHIARAGSADPDPALIRVAELTAAAGDALDVVRRANTIPQPAWGTVDLALGTLNHLARITTVYAERSDLARWDMSGNQWQQLTALTQSAMTHTDPSLRFSDAGGMAILAPGDVGLVASLNRWHAAAMGALQPTESPTTHLPMIAAAMRTAHSAAAATRLGKHHHEHAARWTRALDAWRSGAVRLPGPDDPMLRTHTRVLLTSLDQTVAAYQDGPAGSRAGEQRHELGQFLRHQGPTLQVAYLQRVTQLVNSSRVIIAARALTPVTARPVPVELAQAARAGRWVPLPPSADPATHILGATTTIRGATAPAPAERVDLSAIRAKLAELQRGRGDRFDKTHNNPAHQGPTQR